MSVTDTPSLAPAAPALTGRGDHPGRVSSPLRPGWPFPPILRRFRPAELLAVLRTRSDADAVACAAYFAEVESLGPTTAEHRFALVARRLATLRPDGSLQLTIQGRHASVLLVRAIASAVGLHIITTGRRRGVTFARCACGWLAESSHDGTAVAAELDRRLHVHLLSTIEIDARELAS